MTPLNKSITRRSEATIRDGGRSRRLVITLYPSNVIGLRPEKTRREELIPVDAIWSIAVKMRIAKERADKKERVNTWLTKHGDPPISPEEMERWL